MGLIIFDFDGTIADSLEIFIAAGNRLSKDFGYQPISLAQVSDLRALSLREMMQQARIAPWKLPFFLRRFRQALSPMIKDLQLVKGMREVLLELQQQNYRLGIVTSNSRRNVEAFLHLQGLHHLFEFIYAGQVLSGKTRALKNLARRNRAQPQQLIFIGDETSDIRAAKQAGLANISVSWGFNHRDVLLKAAPDALVDRPEQLVAAIAQLSHLRNQS
jgi:HAD superfamily hydrolase (TIGR01549 family)